MATVKSWDGGSLQKHTQGACFLAPLLFLCSPLPAQPYQDLAVPLKHNDRWVDFWEIPNVWS